MNLIDRLVQRDVQSLLRNGFGDLAAELQSGEYVSERKHCPHAGCDWSLDVQWMDGAAITRWRGYIGIERECQAHLEAHLDL